MNNTILLKNIFILFYLFIFLSLKSQEDLLSTLEQEDKSTNPVIATFKGQRVVSSQTTEQLKKKHLNFNILHRFGNVNYGISEFFGLDQGSIRFILDYGITDKLQVSIGRSSLDKMYDLGFKAKILEQKTGYKSFPLSISYYGNMGINTTSTNIYNYTTNGIYGQISQRLNFTHQLIIAQKMNENISWVIAPTSVWYNVVDLVSQKNFSLFIGTGISAKISRSTRINLEYYPRITDRGSKNNNGLETADHLGFGFDIETGGHVFQLMFTNSNAMLEQQFLTQTTNKWQDFAIRLGFNISRTYSFEKIKQN